MGTTHRINPGAEGGCSATRRCRVVARPLHRLAAARQAKQVSQRMLAQRLKVAVSTVEAEEQEMADLPLSSLYKWADALGVPVTELLVESDASLFSPWVNREQALRLVAIAQAILRQTRQPEVHRMAETLVGQLTSIISDSKDTDPEVPPQAAPVENELDPFNPAPLPDDAFVDTEDNFS